MAKINGRPRKSTTIIQDSVDNQDVSQLIWAFLNHSVYELKQDGKMHTFSGNHIISLIEQLIKLEESKPEDTSEDIANIKDFLLAAK